MHNEYCPKTGLQKFLQAFARDAVKQYPGLKPQITALLELARDEIADGGSPQMECDLARQDINELIKQHKTKEHK